MSAHGSTRSAPLCARTSAVSLERIIDCPFSLAVDEAHVIFPMLEASGGGVRIPYRALALPLPGALTHQVATAFWRQPDATEAGRMHDEIEFDWNARSRWLPNFHGVLRLRIERSRTRVILQGEYAPPFGALGTVFDRWIGRRLATATSADILLRLAQALEARWAAEKQAFPRSSATGPPSGTESDD